MQTTAIHLSVGQSNLYDNSLLKQSLVRNTCLGLPDGGLIAALRKELRAFTTRL